jgi:hypothetical protein
MGGSGRSLIWTAAPEFAWITEESHETFQNSRSSHHDLNLGSPEYEVGTRLARHSVKSFRVKSTQVTTRPPQNWMIFCEIVPVETNIAVKFYCFMATRFFTADIQSYQKTRFLATSCLRKSGITSALMQIQTHFMLISKLIKCDFQWPVTPIHSSQLCFQGLKIWPLTLYFSECFILIFLKNIVCI